MTQLSNDLIDWSGVDTVLLDMDGTLLDLNFDTVFWLQVVPQAYAHSVDRPLSDVMPLLRTAFDSQRGTLNWYDVDYWTRTLSMDVTELQRSFANHIGWLDGAPEFLAALGEAGKHRMLVTNADRKTLGIKNDQTGVIDAVDEAVSSHDFALPKEHPGFWDAFFDAHKFDRERTLFVDDTHSVLASAERAGIGHILAVAQPDSTAVARDMAPYNSVVGVGALLAETG